MWVNNVRIDVSLDADGVVTAGGNDYRIADIASVVFDGNGRIFAIEKIEDAPNDDGKIVSVPMRDDGFFVSTRVFVESANYDGIAVVLGFNGDGSVRVLDENDGAVHLVMKCDLADIGQDASHVNLLRYDVVINYENDDGRRTEGTVRVDAVDFGEAESNALRHADAVGLKEAAINSIKLHSFVGVVQK